MKLRAGISIDRDRYRLLQPLGEGGQGSVWKAEDRLEPGQLRALKLVPLAECSESALERMRREARVLATVSHPSLVTCQGLFEDLRHDVLGLSMEYVEATSLRSALEDPRFTSPHGTAVLRHVAHALAYIHARGLIHRDLKPENVLVTPEFWQDFAEPSHVKLVDFGIAAALGNPKPLTAEFSVIGTMAYLAPELLDPPFFGGVPSSPPVDVFAFGVLGYAVLSRAHPTGLGEHENPIRYCLEYRRSLERNAWPQAVLDGPWGELLARCVALRQEQRPADGEQLRQACDQLAAAPAGPLRILRVPFVEAADAAEPAQPSSGRAPAPPPEHVVTRVASPAAMYGQTEAAQRPDMVTTPHSLPAESLAGPSSARAPSPQAAPSSARASSRYAAPPGPDSAPHALADRRAPGSIGPADAPERAPRRSRTGLLLGVGALALALGVAFGVAARWSKGGDPEAPATAPTASAPSLQPNAASPTALPPEALASDAGTDLDAALAISALPDGCAMEAGVCACCPSGRDCGGSCAEPLPESARFELRVDRVESAGGYPLAASSGTRVCVRTQVADAEWRCVGLAANSAERLELAAADIGRGVEIKVEQSARSEVNARARLRSNLTRLALCEGIVLDNFAGDLQIEKVRLFLVDPSDAGPAAPLTCD